MAFIIANKMLLCICVSLTCWNAAVRYFLRAKYCIFKITTVQELSQKKRVTGPFYLPPRGPFLDSGCVKSDTLSRARIGLSHGSCEAVTL